MLGNDLVKHSNGLKKHNPMKGYHLKLIKASKFLSFFNTKQKKQTIKRNFILRNENEEFSRHKPAPNHVAKELLWRNLYYFYQMNRAKFKGIYHKRSNVETTFSMIKGKFGERLRSKTEKAQINELLCKILCYNICCVIQSMYELGIEADFYRD